MSRIKVDRITDKAGTGAPTLVNGMNVTGKSTMGNIVGAAATFNSITAGGDVTFGANVSIGGTLTYEDVTNIDSVGLITARDGIKVTSGDVDISTGSLGVGLNNPGLKLHIQDGALPSAPAPNGNCDVVIEGTTNTGIQFLSENQTQLRFGDADSTAAGSIIYKHADDNFRLNFSNSGHLSIWDGGGENLRFTPNNEIGIGGANYGTAGQVLSSGGPGAAVQWASVSSVQVSDAWWTASDLPNANWTHQIWGINHSSTPTQRTGFPSVSGQSMSVSGGEWTFPSAGLWKVEWHLQLQSGANSSNDFYLEETTNTGGSWSSGDSISGWNSHFCGNYSSDVSVAALLATINFSNATTYRLRCKLSTNGNAIVRKGTMIIFTKLN